MQVLSEPEVTVLPGRRGANGWTALLRAHATLLRRLETDLEKETGLALADFDCSLSSRLQIALRLAANAPEPAYEGSLQPG